MRAGEHSAAEEQLFAARMPSVLLAIAVDGKGGWPASPLCRFGGERGFCSGQGVQARDVLLSSLTRGSCSGFSIAFGSLNCVDQS